MTHTGYVVNDDCLSVRAYVEEGSVDLIVTSPPYAMQRAKTYGGVGVDDYVEWFMDREIGFRQVLKSSGSFILNIKEHCHGGERHRYIYELVLALRDVGWRLVDEFIWHKKTVMPGKFNGRFKDGFERLYHFTKAKGHYCDQMAVAQPAKDSSRRRARQAERNGESRSESATDSGFGADRKRLLRRERKNQSGFGTNDERIESVEVALPSNVLHVSPETKNKGHSAVFPKAIPEFFIKAFCPPDGVVLDPFMGSGTTCDVAQELGRSYIGMDINKEYCEAYNSKPKPSNYVYQYMI